MQLSDRNALSGRLHQEVSGAVAEVGKTRDGTVAVFTRHGHFVDGGVGRSRRGDRDPSRASNVIDVSRPTLNCGSMDSRPGAPSKNDHAA